MAEEMDELYSKIQMMLMKKNSECGQLKFLSSRTTEENVNHIQDICKGIEEIFKSCGICSGEETCTTNAKCIQSFKYLILNTNFQCQDQLMEDIENSHLVDMCPPISVYLLFEIVHHLKFEEILSESILYFPLDLCNEILIVIPWCTNIMDHKRIQKFIIDIILNSYKRIITICDKETYSLNLTQSLESLVINIQELMVLMGDKKILRLNDGLKKTERLGLILRDLMKLTSDCFACERAGVTLSFDLEKLYRVTFGRDSLMKCTNELVKPHLTSLNNALLLMLLKVLKNIDINTYISWSELEAAGNALMTLQQAIGIDCYHLIEGLQDYKDLENCDSLVNCLRQMSAKPQAVKSKANLDELILKINNGKKECLKELMSRHNAWEHTTFDCIRENISLLDKNDFSVLLDYLTQLMLKPGQEDYKQTVYNTVTRVLVQLKIPDIYDVVLNYILNHNANDTLESAYTEDMFKNFIFRNANLKSPANLRTVLFFLLKNPRKFLRILIECSIGCSEFKHVMLPSGDLLLLSPIMKIHEENKDTMVLNILRTIGLEITDWDTKKFSEFIITMIKEDIFTADQCLNSVFIPLLETNKLPMSSIKFSISCIRQILPMTNDEVNINNMLINLTKIMSFLRSTSLIPRYTINEILNSIIRIINSTLHHRQQWPKALENKSTVDKLISILQPIDLIHFYILWHHVETPDIGDIMTEYSRRVENAVLRVSGDDDVNSLVTSTRLQLEFQRHLILNSTESEYIRIGSEIVGIHWDYFQVNSTEYDVNHAFIDFIKITLDTCRYYLELPNKTSPNSFGFIIKCLVKFIQHIIQVKNRWDYEVIQESLRYNFTLLSKSIKGTEYESLHAEALVFMNNRPSLESNYENVLEIMSCFDRFGSKCLEASIVIEPRDCTTETLKIQIAQDFINDCLKMDEKYSNTIMQRFREFCASE